MISFLIISCILLHAIFHTYWEKTYYDELTKIPNRRALEEYLMGLSGKYTIAMIDVDHFKKFNDNYNHEMGDQVLVFIASLLEEHLDGQIYRYGGEEFCAIFPKIDPAKALESADNVRKMLKGKKIPIHLKNGTVRRVQITISIGIAKARPGPSPHVTIKAADRALYKAKKAGRNRVMKAA